VRVTPSVFTRPEQMDALVQALSALA
jgi:isopenicillin-N epimerase